MLKLTFYIWFDDEQSSELDMRNLEFNPGIGGTQFVTMLIVTELAKAAYHTRIITNKKITSLHDDIEVVHANNYADLLVRVAKESSSINIFTNEIYNKYKNIVSKDAINILWMHHPHQIVFDRKVNAVVSIGEYQFESNIVSHVEFT